MRYRLHYCTQSLESSLQWWFWISASYPQVYKMINNHFSCSILNSLRVVLLIPHSKQVAQESQLIVPIYVLNKKCDCKSITTSVLNPFRCTGVISWLTQLTPLPYYCWVSSYSRQQRSATHTPQGWYIHVRALLQRYWGLTNTQPLVISGDKQVKAHLYSGKRRKS